MPTYTMKVVGAPIGPTPLSDLGLSESQRAAVASLFASVDGTVDVAAGRVTADKKPASITVQGRAFTILLKALGEKPSEVEKLRIEFTEEKGGRRRTVSRRRRTTRRRV